MDNAVRKTPKSWSIPREHDELYSQRKREWEEKHPEATPREYEQAMQRIARELGL